MTYSSWSAEGRTSVMVAWKSSTGVADLTHRSTVAGPTMVVAVLNGVVWKAMPSAVGTVVQSHSGSAAQAFPPGGRLVGGRAPGSRVKVVLDCFAGAAACSAPCATEVERLDRAGRRPTGEVGRVGRLGIARSGGTGPVVEQHPDQGGLGGEVRPGRGHVLGLGEPDGRQRGLGRGARGEAGELVEDEGGQGTRLGRHLVGHVDVEELEPPADGLGVGRVDVAAVDHVGEQRRGRRDGVDQGRPLRARSARPGGRRRRRRAP